MKSGRAADLVPIWESGSAPGVVIAIGLGVLGFALFAFSPPTFPRGTLKGWGIPTLRKENGRASRRRVLSKNENPDSMKTKTFHR